MDLSHLTSRLDRNCWSGTRPLSKESETLLEAFDWMGPDAKRDPVNPGPPRAGDSAFGQA
jgi:hypothetical protein